MTGKAPALPRHPQSGSWPPWRPPVYLEAKATDDALEPFDVLMANDLMARAVKSPRRQAAPLSGGVA